MRIAIQLPDGSILQRRVWDCGELPNPKTDLAQCGENDKDIEWWIRSKESLCTSKKEYKVDKRNPIDICGTMEEFLRIKTPKYLWRGEGKWEYFDAWAPLGGTRGAGIIGGTIIEVPDGLTKGE